MGMSASAPVGNGQFRKKMEQSPELTTASDLTHTGVFGDYFFAAGEEKKKDFAPSYSFGVIRDPLTQNLEHYLCVGLNSKFDGEGIKVFGRPRVQLVIALDVSGSMNIEFDHGDQERSKLEIAKSSLITLTNRLQKDDMLGIVTFNEECQVIQPLCEWGEIDKERLLGKVKALQPGGGTSLSAGFTGAYSLYDAARKKERAVLPPAVDCTKPQGELDARHARPLERRIMFFTDMQPTAGEMNADGLFGIADRCAKVGVYTTFIGVGLDFNSELVTHITHNILGASYLCVLSENDFTEQMTNDFDYLITPIVFNLKLKLVSAAGVVIDKVYGSPDADAATGELMKVGTLFASNRNEKGETKGGVILIKLKFDDKQYAVEGPRKSQQKSKDEKKGEDALVDQNDAAEGVGEAAPDDGTVVVEGGVDHVSLTLSVSFSTRDSEGVTTEETEVQLKLHAPDHYDNDNGVRKAILLTKYVSLIQDSLSLRANTSTTAADASAKRQALAKHVQEFQAHFQQEQGVIQDPTLSKEFKVLTQTLRALQPKS